MNKVNRQLTTKFLEELNYKFDYNELTDFLTYAKLLYEDFLIVEKFYKDEFNAVSPITINRYIITFNNLYNKIIERI